MIDLLRLCKSEPLMVSAVAFCLTLVVGLLLSDWAERRRERQVVESRRQAANAGELARSAAVASPQSESPRPHRQRPFYRVFRWEFLLLAVVSIAAIAFLIRSGKATVSARGTVSDPTVTGKRGVEEPTPPFASPIAEYPVHLTLGVGKSTELPESLTLAQSFEYPETDVLEWREDDLSGYAGSESSPVAAEAFDYTDWQIIRTPGQLRDYHPPQSRFEGPLSSLSP